MKDNQYSSNTIYFNYIIIIVIDLHIIYVTNTCLIRNSSISITDKFLLIEANHSVLKN